MSFEYLLRQTVRSRERRFRIFHRREEVGVSCGGLRHDHLCSGLFDSLFRLVDCGLLGCFESFLLGLFRQFLTGRLFQRLDKLLLVLERADVVLLLGVDQGRALERLVIDAGFQLVEQVDHVLLGHVEGDALGFGHLLQLDHGEVMQPAARRNLLELVRQLLRLLEGRLFLRQELDQVVLGAEQADLMFLELGIERGSGEAGVVHARLRRVEQMDEVGFGPGDGDAVLLGQGLELLHA